MVVYTPARVKRFRVRFSAVDQEVKPPALIAEVEAFLEQHATDAVALGYGVHFHAAFTKNLKQARELGRKAVDADPGSAEGWRNMATALAVSGRRKAALDAVERAATIDPHDYQTFVMRGKLLAAWSLAGPLRRDLARSLIDRGQVAGVGLAEDSVVGRRVAVQQVVKLDRALVEAGATLRVEQLPGPFLWHF